jgi:hypothetical protein
MERAPRTDAIGWLASPVISPCPEVRDSAGRIVKLECRSDSGAVQRFAEVKYDEGGRPITVDVHADARDVSGISYSFDLTTDAAGRIDTATMVGLPGGTTFFSHDDASRLIRIVEGVDGAGALTELSYSEEGALLTLSERRRIADEALERVVRTFDETGRGVMRSHHRGEEDVLLVTLVDEYDETDGRLLRRVRDILGDGEIDEIDDVQTSEDGRIVALYVDIAPLGEIDHVATISGKCCSEVCAGR